MRYVLVIEDEPNIVSVVKAYLEKEGYSVATAYDGVSGLEAFKSKKPDAVILDIMLPLMDGLEVCRQIRQSGDVPVIMLTARVEEIDRIIGLELGADDYITKPFSPRELVARLRAVLRRAGRATGQQKIRVGKVEIDTGAHSAYAAGKPLHLTPAEFALLEKMMREPGRVFTRQQLLDAFDQSFDGYERNTDTHIKNLRRKLGEHLDETYIHTVYGVGYRFENPYA